MMNSEKAVSEELSNFERRENPFSLQVRGICLWRVVRSSVFSKMQNIKLDGEAPSERKDVIKAAIRSLRCVAYAVLRRKKTKYGVVSYPVALRVPDDDDRYADFYYQSILDEIPGGVRLLHGPMSRKEKKTKRGILNLDLSIIYLMAAVLARIFPVRSEDGAYIKLADLISRNFPMDGMDELSLARWFSVFWWRSKLKGIFFRIIGLQSVLMINSSEYSIVSAAVSSGIKAVELQHGIYTENHPDVLSNDVVLTYGREALFLPDVIGLYGNYWADRLRPIYIGSDVRVVAVGNSICDWARGERVKKHSRNRTPLTILVTTQGMQQKELIEFIKESLAVIPLPVSFIIKLHPSYDKDKMLYLSEFRDDDRVRVVAGNELPATFDLLAMVDVHASIASACHYDALMMGVPTIVLGLSGSELMTPLIENGSAAMANDPESMARIISDQEWIMPSRESQEYYCRSDFINNLKNEMR